MQTRRVHPRIRKACKAFFVSFPEFYLIEWDGDEVTAFKKDDPEPFVAIEFRAGTISRRTFEEFEELICEEEPFRFSK